MKISLVPHTFSLRRSGWTVAVFEQSADRACAVQRALRPAQDLEPVDLIGQQVEREGLGPISVPFEPIRASSR